MNFKLSSSKKADYLVIKASGEIVDIADWKMLNKLYYDEFVKHDAKKVVIDEMEMEMTFPLGLINLCELVDSYSEELPIEIRRVKLAVAVDSKHKSTADFWETYAHNRGYHYKVFYSMEDALKYMDE